MPPKKAKTPSKEEYDDLAMECEQQKRQAELAQEAVEGYQKRMAQLVEREMATMRAFYDQQGQQQGQQQGLQQQGNEQHGSQGLQQGLQQQGQQHGGVGVSLAEILELGADNIPSMLDD